MKIQLTNTEAEQFFYEALCNGLNELHYYDLSLEFNQSEYDKAKAELKLAERGFCYEDILMQMLRNGAFLRLVDDGGYEEPAIIWLSDVHERVANTELRHLVDMMEGNDDACTADAILQTVFLGEVIFG